VRRGSLYLGGARLRKDLTRFRKAPQVSAALSSAAPLRVPSRAQRLPPPRRFVLVLESGRACRKPRTLWLNLERLVRLGARIGIASEITRTPSGLRGALQVFPEPRPTKAITPKPLLSGASPYRHPAVSTTLRVRCSSGHGQKRNTSTQALLTPGCSTDKRAN
jgi:hypothetical protein